MSPAEPFDFVSEEATVGDLARAAARHYSVSILVDPKLSGRKVTGVLHGANLAKTIEAISFYSGTTVRASTSGDSDIFYLGRDEAEQFMSTAVGGSDVTAIRSVFGQAVVVGDQLVFKAKPSEYSELDGIMRHVTERHVATFEILIWDSSSSFGDQVNDWLRSLSIGATLTGTLKHSTFRLPVDFQGLVNLLRTKTDAVIRTRQTSMMLSGQNYVFTSGNQQLRPVYTRTAASQQGGGAQADFVTSYQTIQLGLQFTLRPFLREGRWVVEYQIQDNASNGAGAAEGNGVIDLGQTLSTTGMVEMRDTLPLVVMSMTREQKNASRTEVPGLAKLPVVGRAFRGKSNRDTRRTVYCVIRRLEETVAVPAVATQNN